MADVIKTIGGTAPDYATWTLFEAAIPANISLATGTNERWIGKGRDVSFAEDFAISGIVTDATNRVVLTYDTGAKHDGRSRDVSGTGCQIKGANAAGTIRPTIQHLTINGLDITASVNSSPINWSSLTAVAGSDHLVDSCIVHNPVVSGTDYVFGNVSRSNFNLRLINTVAYTGKRIIDTRSCTSAEITNCTFWLHTDQLGIVADTELTCRNTYIGKSSGTAECFWTGSTPPAGSNNASSDATASIDYTSSLINIVGVNQFNSVTVGAEDFRLKTGADLIDAGVTIAGLTVDNVGTSRPQGSVYDIGANEFIVVGGAYSIIGNVTTTFSSAAILDYTMTRLLNGSSSVTLTGNAALDYNQNKSISGDVTTTLTSNAVMQQNIDRELIGNSSVVLTSNATLTRNINPSLLGSGQLTVTGNGAFVHNINPSLLGSGSVTNTANAGMTYASGNQINGDSNVVLTSNAGLDYTLNASLAGSGSVNLSSNAGLAYSAGLAIVGDSVVQAIANAILQHNINPSIVGNSLATLIGNAELSQANIYSVIGDCSISLIAGATTTTQKDVVLTGSCSTAILADGVLNYTQNASIEGSSLVAVQVNGSMLYIPSTVIEGIEQLLLSGRIIKQFTLSGTIVKKIELSGLITNKVKLDG